MTRTPCRTKLAPVPVLVARSAVPASPIRNVAIKRRAERMLGALGLEHAELSLLLCDDREIHALNKRHRRKNKPTDVLAFAMQEGTPMPRGRRLLGDVVISLDTARRQAQEFGRPLWDEVTLLLAHGLLHLVGYDHQTDAEEARMNREVARLVAAVKNAASVTPARVDKDPRAIAKRSGRAPTGIRRRAK